MNILILTDGKAGHENQSRAFARALGGEAVVRPVAFRSRLAKALSYLADRLGIASLGLFTASPLQDGDRFAAVIGTGSGTFYAAKVAAHRLGVRCGVVLYPRGYSLSSFDCILAPKFDRPAKAGNVVEIPANLVANDAEFYARGTADFLRRTGLAAERVAATRTVAVIIGGPNQCATMTPEWMRGELRRVFSENAGAKFWVTTSRRTPAAVERVVEEFPWDYRLLYSQDHFNPSPAFVSLAGRLYVTAESTGMLSEACTFGKAEVFALDNLRPGPHKFRRFIEDLTAGGYLNGENKVDLSAAFAQARKLLGL